MAQKYKSKWTGPQVDEAIGNVSKKIDKDSLIGSDGITIKKTDSNIEISGVELVKKTIETNKVYGTDSTGGQTLKPFADTPTPSALAAYNEVSNLKTSVPVEDLDCTNKKYVDDNLNSILYHVQRDTQYSTALLTTKNIGKYYTFTTSVLTTSDYWVDPDNITVNAGTVVKILPIEDSHGAGIKPFFKIVDIDNRELYLTNGQGKCSIVKRAYGSDTTPKAIGYYSNVFSVDTDSQFGGQATSKYSTLFGVNVRADSNAEGSIVGGRYCIIDSPYTFAYGRSITTQASQETITKVVLGYNNKFNTKAILEIGNGTDSINSNAFEVLKDGRAKVQTAPKDNDDVVRKLELDRKFDKAGGTVTGNMVVGGNFTVQGRTTTVDSENLRVTDKLIEVGKGNTAPLTSPAGLFTPKYDGQNNGGIVYDNTGTAYVGDISLDSNGNVDVNNSDLQPIATRNATITNNNLVKWDSGNLKLVDAGKNVENLVDKLPASLRNQAYVRNANGEDSGLAYTYTDEGNSLALRNASGQLQVSDPSQDNDAANKKYVDDAVSSVSSLVAPITFETVDQLDNYVKTSASAKKGQIASVLNTTEQRAYLIIAVGE